MGCLRASVLAVAFAANLALTACSGESTDPATKIAIVSAAEIDPIVALREGFKEEIRASSWARGKTIDFDERFNAQGDDKLFSQVADDALASEPDLIYVLGTPLAQTIQNRRPDLLLVQGAVTDPVESGLAASWEGSGRKYVATSDLPPIEKQLEVIRALIPSARAIGVVYNPGESNSVAVVKRIRASVASKPDLKLVERGVSGTSQLPQALESLAGNVDVIYVPPDNTVFAAMDSVGNFSRGQRVPLFTTDTGTLHRGALAAVALDFRELGRESARLALRALQGEDPGSIPIQVTRNPEVVVSRTRAQELDISLDRARAAGWTVR